MIRPPLHRCWLVAACFVFTAPSTHAQDPATAVKTALHREADEHFARWQTEYEKLDQPDRIETRQRSLRAEFTKRIGGIPRPTALHPVVTGTVERDGYRVEKIMFESQPNFFVTGALFLPDPQRFPPPWPAALVLCGHSTEGKQQLGYQSGCALAALNGLAAFIVDPVGQGERMQVLNDQGKPAINGTTTEHTILGTSATLVGWNTARWMIGDAMAAVDYLQSRTDIMPDRIGCMGNSGGGTQTSYLMALDERIHAAAPSCYITSFDRLLETIGPQDAEQNIFGQIALGMDHADYLMMRAPKPTLVASATKDFFDIEGTWKSFRAAKRIYQRFGAGRNVELVEVDAEHGWHPLIREASVQFMVQHLAGRLINVPTPEIKTLTLEEIQVTPEGQVLRLPNAVSAFQHVEDESRRLAAQRATQPTAIADQRSQIRQLAAIRSLADIPQPTVQLGEPTEVSGFRLRAVSLAFPDGVTLAAWLAGSVQTAAPNENTSADDSRQATCVFFSEGKDSALSDPAVQAILKRGDQALLVDLRGVGDTQAAGKPWYHQRFGANGGNAVLAYLLGKSFVGLRAEDAIAAARWLSSASGIQQVNVIASGELVIPVLHAAALEPGLFADVATQRGPASWSEVIAHPEAENQMVNLVHAALTAYDLPDLKTLAKQD